MLNFGYRNVNQQKHMPTFGNGNTGFQILKKVKAE